MKKRKVPVTIKKIESDIHQNISDIVNNWISERRANRLAEKSFSDEKISAWKIISSPSNIE